MESPVVRSRGRPRKRRREEAQNPEIDNSNTNNNNTNNNNNDTGDEHDVVENDDNNQQDVKNMGNSRKRGRPPKKRPVEIRGQALVGCFVLKEFEGSGVFLGKIVSYDSGLYRVDYEDGDCEDLDSRELREYLIGNERERFVGDLLDRKKKLDEKVAEKTRVKLKDEEPKKRDVVKMVIGLENRGVAKSLEMPDKGDVKNMGNDAGKVQVSELSEHSDGEIDGSEVDDDDDADSSSDSCEYGQGWDTRSETEIPSIPPPELPPSSGTIGVPEEYVSHLFSVYGFLRSFSIRLFLSPFTLDDLVGCLNCTVPNTLLDAIHVALLRALRRHLETVAPDGSELASKCLRCIDWALLDSLTWPVYLVHYLMTMGYFNGHEWKGFYADVLEKDYCTLSISTKLTVLQILCDDALDTAEIRAEVDMREESEVGVDSDGITIPPLENRPRKVPTRYSKSSVGRDRDCVNPDAGNSIPFTPNSSLKGDDHNRNADDVDEDGNGDECRLCGMDGMLLCCDGCPSAYHSRCIGVNKLSIPEGEWFCPECTISSCGPAITVGTSLKGAEVFGVDSYAQLFMGTCDHLLVLKVSVKTSPFVRYYNCNDIPKVITALCSSPHHTVSYLGICQAILKYWEMPEDILPPLISMALEKKDKDVLLPTQLRPFGDNGSEKVSNNVEFANYASKVGESSLDNESRSGIEKFTLEPGSGNVSLSVPTKTDLSSVPRICGATMIQNSTNMTSRLSQPEVSGSTEQGLADRSSLTGIATCTSGYNSSSSAGHKNGVCLPGNINMYKKEVSSGAGARLHQKGKNACLYMGSIFKPLAYINHYVHGDFAASAAANFAVLSSEESRASEVQASDPRKVMSAKITLQGKAFSSVAVRFFWPSTEKKLFEVPRERCSWCLHCKAPVTSKKACLLNQAALNATRAAVKFVSGLRLVKSVENRLYGIATYTLYMEESLRGLILGPFLSESYRQQWRKKVELASTCSDMKSLLLELEGNLCTIALSTEWTKLVDNWMDESSVPQSVCATGSTQKRGQGRRRRPPATLEATADDSKENLSDLSWWRGGKLAKLVFQRGTLPCSVLRKAARQGGSRKIPGIYYAEGSDVPKRSRQFIWRAAVEKARNASQLALQVRYLDHHIKWSDLLRPEQNIQEGKGPESEASAFRNAQICGKKVVENKIMYGVVFGHQKHLSTRLMKSIIEKESQDGKDKYWFSETRIPLYLIKEYEENAEKTYLPPPTKPDNLSKHQRRQLRAYRKDAFRYLANKRDDLDMCLCASCHQDVEIKDAVKCSGCEGYCHKACTMNSTALTNEDLAFVTTCKQCLHGKALPQNNSSVESPTSPLAMHGQDYQASATVAKSVRSKCTSQQQQNSAASAKNLRPKRSNQQLPSVGTPEGCSEKKPSSSDSNLNKRKRQCHWGLIWKKKNVDEDGSDFRLRNILYRGNSSDSSVMSTLKCHLCNLPYNPHLMYIHCETCQNWYHADALELDESRLSELVGFKCCRCRRIKSPVCPYADSKPKKTEGVKRIRIKGPKEGPTGVTGDSVSGAISEQTESLPSTPISLMDEDDVFIQVDDPLLLSVSKVEQIPEPKAEADLEWNNNNIPSGPGPQKLPIRRHIKNEKEDDGFGWSIPNSADTKNISNPIHSQWGGVSEDGLENGPTFDYNTLNFENTDFEPQTYFSFTELLEADDGSNQFEGVDPSGGGAWENLTCENSRSGFLEQCELGSSNVAASLEPENELACNVCLQAPPAPDLCCSNCGLKIHSNCSPWDEFPQQEESWSCGNCRVWR